MINEETGWWKKHPFLLLRYKNFLSKRTCLSCRHKYNFAVMEMVAKGSVADDEELSIGFNFEDLCDKCQSSDVVRRIKEVAKRQDGIVE